jgi:hypothetical protein
LGSPEDRADRADLARRVLFPSLPSLPSLPFSAPRVRFTTGGRARGVESPLAAAPACAGTRAGELAAHAASSAEDVVGACEDRRFRTARRPDCARWAPVVCVEGSRLLLITPRR